MIYKFKEKEINIPDEVLDNYVDTLEISLDEAIEMYLDDNGYIENEEAAALTAKAKENKITGKINKVGNRTKGMKREVVRKEDPDKEFIIAKLKEALIAGTDANNIQVTNIGKIIEFEFNGNMYKLDLIKRRK